MTFGDLSHFYANLSDYSLQNEIAKAYSEAIDTSGEKRRRITPERLKGYLWVLTDFRNVCAHDERFYCHISARVRTFNAGKTDVGGLIKIIRRLLSEKDSLLFTESISQLATKYRQRHGVSNNVSEAVFKIMGHTE